MVGPGELHNLLADLAVGGQIAGAELAAVDPLGRADLGPVVLRLVAGVQQPGRLEGHLMTQPMVSHG